MVSTWKKRRRGRHTFSVVRVFVPAHDVCWQFINSAHVQRQRGGGKLESIISPGERAGHLLEKTWPHTSLCDNYHGNKR